VNKRKECTARKNKLISYDKLGCDIALSANFDKIYLFANPRTLVDNHGRIANEIK